MNLTEVTDDQQAGMQLARKKYAIPPELMEAERLRAERKPDEALKLCIGFMNQNFDHVPAIVLAAHILIDAERYGLAQPLMKLAVSLEPDESIVWNNLGLCYQEGDNITEARECFIKAVKRNPNDALAWNNLSKIYVDFAEPEKAINCAEKALSITANLPEARFNMGQAHLMMRNWKQGWEGYEQNLGKHNSRRERIYGITPRWTGVNDLTLICYGEQGLGDEMAFASCIHDLQKNNKIVIECNRKLEGLFRRSFGCDVYGTTSEKQIQWPLLYNIDASVAMGSLPQYFRQKTEDFPGSPYLKADPDRRFQWRALLDKLSTKKKIGIAWTGGLRKTGAEKRSLTLAELEPILRQDATFISLQYKDASMEIDKLYRDKGIMVHQWSHATLTQDYDDTAALVAELDLVISVTTAVVDLAGALGTPCWVLTPSQPIWRFGLDGQDYPFCKSIKLYRQKKTDWLNVIAEVGTDLRKLCSQSSVS